MQVIGKVKRRVKRCITCVAGAKEDHKSFTNGTVICILAAVLYQLKYTYYVATTLNMPDQHT